MADWGLEVTAKELKDLENLPAKDRERVKARMEALAKEQASELKKVQGGSGEWLLRVGKWCVRFERDGAARKIRILRVLPRRDPYRQ